MLCYYSRVIFRNCLNAFCVDVKTNLKDVYKENNNPADARFGGIKNLTFNYD